MQRGGRQMGVGISAVNLKKFTKNAAAPVLSHRHLFNRHAFFSEFILELGMHFFTKMPEISMNRLSVGG
jgi:hypothetical protein